MPKGTRGYDAGKRVDGRKRFIVTDTLGLLIVVMVCAASVQDRDGAKQSLLSLYFAAPVRFVFADGGFAGQFAVGVAGRAGVQRGVDAAEDAGRGPDPLAQVLLEFDSRRAASRTRSTRCPSALPLAWRRRRVCGSVSCPSTGPRRWAIRLVVAGVNMRGSPNWWRVSERGLGRSRMGRLGTVLAGSASTVRTNGC